MQETITCKNCGNQFSGKFCNNCGEKVYYDKNKTIAHLFDESLHFITHLDGAFFKTMRLVFFKPGTVSKDYTEGIRKRYFKPVSLFLVGVVLYLLFPFFQGLNIPLKQHQHEMYGSLAKVVIERKAKSKSITIDELSHKYDAKSPKFAKILMLVILPLSGLALALLFFKRKDYFFDHFIAATELNTFYLYFTFFVIPIIFLTINGVVTLMGGKALTIGDLVTIPLYLIVFGTVCAVAFKRFYAIGWGHAIMKSALFLGLHFIIVYTLYRIILLFAVLLFI